MTLDATGVALSQDVLIFQLAHAACAIACSQVREIVPMAETLRLPGQPALLEGFLNLRGDPVPVVLLRRLLGLPAATLGLYTPVVLIGTAAGQIGLCVDRVLQVESVESSDLKPLPANHALNDYAAGEFSSDGQRVILLDGNRLLLAEERLRLEELQAEGKRRLTDIEASRK